MIVYGVDESFPPRGTFHFEFSVHEYDAISDSISLHFKFTIHNQNTR